MSEKTDNSFVQRMIKALAEIDRLITGAESPNTPLALAPEVVVEKVRKYVERKRGIDREMDETIVDFLPTGRHA